MANTLAIVGRPNVGKSTLFNRLIEKKQAIMDNQSGVTRDRHYGYAEWNGKKFTVIDTGGYVTDSNDVFEKAIRTQVIEALKEATAILFMVDCKEGVHALDQDFSQLIREIKKPVYIAVNKADTYQVTLSMHEFHALGLDSKLFPITSTSGSGTGDLLDEITLHFEGESTEEDNLPKIAILGKPNVGKSSFINALLGTERSIVTEIAGTTRDAVHSNYTLFDKNFILIDTAGIRKKSRVKDNIEFYSTLRAIQALQDSDVCIIMIDATEGIQAQDLNLIGLANRYKKGILIMINKWDLIAKNTQTMKTLTETYQKKLGDLAYASLLFTSVLNKQRIMQTIEQALNIYDNRNKKILTSKLNEILGEHIKKYPPPAVRGHYIKIKYITQLPSTQTPTFVFFCNFPQYIKKPYQRYLINRIREHFDFKGVSIQVVFRKK